MKDKLLTILGYVIAVIFYGGFFYFVVIKKIIFNGGDVKTNIFYLILALFIIALSFFLIFIAGPRLYEFLDDKGYGFVFKIGVAVLVVAFFIWFKISSDNEGMVICEYCNEKFEFVDPSETDIYVYSDETICYECLLHNAQEICQSCGVYSIHSGEFIDGFCPVCDAHYVR